MSLRDAACFYADRGWAIFPLKPRSKQPDGRLTPHGMNDATTDLARVFWCWERSPRLNIGLNCEASGLVVLDVDPRNGGEDGLHEAIAVLGPLPRTVEAHSGGGGQHLLFKHPGGSFRREVAPGVDIKCSGYIVAPPSIHPSGKPYLWSVDGDPEEIEPAELPEAWVKAMRVRQRRAATQTRNTTSGDGLKEVPAATYASRLAGRMVDEDGWMQCPFHKGGMEKTPSFRVDGTLWACYACDPIGGKSMMGGNILDLAALLWGYPIPVVGPDYAAVRKRLEAEFG
jgi:hypothetical protein